MKTFLAILALVLGTCSWAQRCYVIDGSGKRIDQEDRTLGIVVDKLSLKGARGAECKVFDSWVSLKQYYNKIGGTQNVDTVIFQITQGFPGGYCYSNICKEGERETPHYIMDVLNTISSTNKTLLIDNSPFSGDLIKTKLLDDLENSAQGDLSPTYIGNQCVITGTVFGNSNTSNKVIRSFLEGPIGQNMNDLFLGMEQTRNGLISSAEYNGVNITSHIIGVSDNEDEQILLNIKRVIEDYNPGDIKSRVALGSFLQSHINDESYEVMAYMDYLLGKKDIVVSKEGLLQSLQHRDTNSCEPLLYNEVSHNKKEGDPDNYLYLMRKLSKCSYLSALACNRDQLIETCNDIAGDARKGAQLFKDLENFKIYRNIIRERTRYAVDIMEDEIAMDKREFFIKMANVDFEKLIRDNVRDYNFSSSRKRILDGILGDMTYPLSGSTQYAFEVNGVLPSDDIINFNAQDKTRRIMNGFVRASLKKPIDLYTKPLDQMRRTACANFKLWNPKLNPSQFSETNRSNIPSNTSPNILSIH